MSKYAIYRMFDGCDAPYNVEFCGHLVGSRVWTGDDDPTASLPGTSSQSRTEVVRMPTSDERREVAERLRGLARERGAVECSSVAHTLGLAYEVHGTIAAFSGDAVARLADLMDPTCEMVVKNGHACCGRCGHRLADECEVEEDYYEFRPFCPDCGARITCGGDA